MSSDPAYRGTMLRTIVKMVDDEPLALAAVRKRVRDDELDAMRNATRLAWLPAEPFDRLKQAHYEHAGPDAYVSMWRRYVGGISDNPMFHNLLEGGMRIFGATPAGLLKWMPKGWALTARGCGSMHTELAQNHATMILRDIPLSARHPSTPRSTHGSVLGLFDLVSMQGEVTTDDSRTDEGYYEIHATWR